MKWEEVRVFITGIDGFVGSHIARALFSKGSHISGLLHKPIEKGKSRLLVWKIADIARNYIGDVTDKDCLESILVESNPQWIVHLAAQTIVAYGQANAYDTLETNIKGTYNILDIAAKLPEVRGIIVASSDKAYGSSLELPYTEEMPLRGGSIYDSSKACADLVTWSLAKRFDLPLCITRCANIYGPGDLHFSRIVPDTIQSVINGNAPVIRGSGKHERDFIYIDDVISGYLKLADYLNQHHVSGEAFNFGTGNAVRILDLVQMIINLSYSKIKASVILRQDNPAEIMKQCIDATKAQTLLRWTPHVSLPDGLKCTIDWYRTYFASEEVNETSVR